VFAVEVEQMNAWRKLRRRRATTEALPNLLKIAIIAAA
jgi:hypothetical protein